MKTNVRSYIREVSNQGVSVEFVELLGTDPSVALMGKLFDLITKDMFQKGTLYLYMGRLFMIHQPMETHNID